MRKLSLGLIAITLATGAAFATKVSNKTVKPLAADYFQFVGTHGQEGDENRWNRISASTYAALNCNSVDQMGCKIIAESTGAATPRPVQVTVDGSTVPVISSTIYAVVNKSIN